MSRRYGRKQRRKHIKVIADLSDCLDLAYGEAKLARRQSAMLQSQLRRYDDEMRAAILPLSTEAKAQVIGMFSESIVKADNELMRQALMEMRASGLRNMEFDVISLGPVGSAEMMEEPVRHVARVIIRGPIVWQGVVRIVKGRRHA